MPSSWLSTPSARRPRPGWAQVEQLLNGADGARAVSKVLQSPLVQSLREQQAEVERQAAELTQEFGDRHPELINIHADAEDLRQKVTEEVDRIGQGLRNDVSVARARGGTLETALDRLRDEVGQADTDEVTLRGCYERVLGDMFDGNWHLDRGEVGPEWVTIYYERREIGRFPTLAEFHHPLFVLADLGLHREDPRTIDDPADMQIDYIRVWQRPEWAANG